MFDPVALAGFLYLYALISWVMKILFFIYFSIFLVFAVSCKKDRDPSSEEQKRPECQVMNGRLTVVYDNSGNVFDQDVMSEEFTYDGQGRISRYKRAAITAYDQSYTIDYTYNASGITEKYTSDENEILYVRLYTLGADNRISRSTLVQSAFDIERTVIYDYDGQGYLIKKHIRTEGDDPYETSWRYIYENGDLTRIDQDMHGDGQTIYKTDITYAEQPQNSFIFHNGYPVLDEQYGHLSAYFGKPSKHMIASIREYLGFGYANYQYEYQQNEHGFVERVKTNTDTNQGQEYVVRYTLNCN